MTSYSQISLYIEIANIHKQEISDGFLATFSNNFLVLLYKTIATSKYSFLYVYKNNDNVLGFICGCTDTQRLYLDFIKRTGFKTVLYIIPKLFSPKTIVKIFETLVYPNREVNRDLPESEILNFCVSGRTQGKGIGKKLFSSLIEEFKSLGISEIKIVTGQNQVSAQRFYEKIGARKVADIQIHKETDSIIYTYKFETHE